MARFSLLIDRFDGGYNSKVSPLIANLSESPDLQNVEFNDVGSVETRKGSAILNSAFSGSSPVDLLHSFFNDDGVKQLMYISSGDMYRMSGNTEIIIPSAQSIYTNNIPVQAVNFQNKMFISNGGALPYKWNGSEFTQWGIPSPSSPTAAIGSDGTLTGNYKYVVIGLNSEFVQGNYGSESVEVSATTNNINLTDIPVFPVSAGVNTKQVCRNTALASGLYYVVTEISNAQTTYLDDNDDSLLVTEVPLDQGVPPYFTCILNHQNRMFGASNTSSNKSFLWFSKLNKPEVFSSDNFLEIGEGDGYPITALGLLSNHLIIAKNDGQGNGATYLLYMPDANPINWTVAKLDTESGGQSASVMVKYRNFLAYINRYGIFDLNEFAVGDIRSDPLSFNIEKDIFTLSNDFLYKADAITWKNKVWFSVPYGSLQQTNNKIYQYDFVKGRAGVERELGAWSVFTDLNVANFTIHDGDLYGGSSKDDGYIYKLDTGTNDDGAAIDSYFKTMAISGIEEHRNHTKVWRFAFITLEASGDWFLDIEYLNDFDLVGSIEQVNLNPGGSEYGKAIISTDFWGPGTTKKKIKISFDNSVSKTFQLKFYTNTADEYFKLHEIEIFYNIRGLRSGD